MPDYVWVKDPGSGHSGPLPKEQADALGSAVKVDAKHPTHDAHGDLMPWVTKTTVAKQAAAKGGQSADNTKEK